MLPPPPLHMHAEEYKVQLAAPLVVFYARALAALLSPAEFRLHLLVEQR